MMTRYLISTIILLTGFYTTIYSQNLEVGYGNFGTLIYWQGEIPTNSSAEIRRTGPGEARTWKIHPASSLQDVLHNVENMPVIFKGLFGINRKSAAYYLDKLRSASHVNSIPFSTTPNVLFALGLAVWDTTVLSGKTYKYRIFINDRPISEGVTLETIIPDMGDWKPQVVEATNNERGIRCKWRIPYDKKDEVYSFLAYRTAPFVPDYQLVRGNEVFSIHGDTINAVFIDTTAIDSMGVYHYVIRTVDRFGRLGNPSEYAEGSNFPPGTEPLITYFKATGLEDRPAIKLEWELKSPWRVRSLTLYKSSSWDGPYTLVAHVSQHDSTYIDPVIDVMESYFYYFEYNDIVQEEPIRSVRTTAVSEYIWPAVTPDSLIVQAEGPAIRISWKSESFQDRGFYVLRTEGYGEPKEIVSPFILAIDSINHYSWLDTTFLKADMYYSYAVISESIGYEKSHPTEAKAARIEVPVYIPTPTDLKISRQNDTTFMLTWKDLSRDESNNLLGYRVYKKNENAQDGYKLVNEKLLLFEKNYLLLHDITPEDSFMVQAINIYGDTSAGSEWVAIDNPFFYKFGPQYLMGKKTQKGIRVKWNTPLRAGVIKYHLYRINAEGQTSEIATLDYSETTYLDKDVKQGEAYYYFITAETENGLKSKASELLYISL